MEKTSEGVRVERVVTVIGCTRVQVTDMEVTIRCSDCPSSVIMRMSRVFSCTIG
jgi:hypothetical protein